MSSPKKKRKIPESLIEIYYDHENQSKKYSRNLSPEEIKRIDAFVEKILKDIREGRYKPSGGEGFD